LLYSDDLNFAGLLGAGGLDEVAIQRVSYECTYATADELWVGFLASSVRIAAVINSQVAATRQRIRREFDRLADEATIDGVIRLPAVVCLGSGRKPPA